MTKTYYNLCSTQFDPKEFVATYAPMYLKDNYCHVPWVKQSYEKLENDLIDRAKSDLWDESLIFDIMAWKTGKIKLKESVNADKLVFADGCSKKQMKLQVRGKELHIGSLANYITNPNNLKDLKSKSGEDAIEAFRCLSNNSEKGIGTVYLFTLVYFLSNRKQPIYDTYVWRALQAIERHLAPGSKIKEAVPDKTSTNERIEQFYIPFRKTLFDLFGEEEYCKSRDIDRALWVYGHYFKVLEETSC